MATMQRELAGGEELGGGARARVLGERRVELINYYRWAAHWITSRELQRHSFNLVPICVLAALLREISGGGTGAVAVWLEQGSGGGILLLWERGRAAGHGGVCVRHLHCCGGAARRAGKARSGGGPGR